MVALLSIILCRTGLPDYQLFIAGHGCLIIKYSLQDMVAFLSINLCMTGLPDDQVLLSGLSDFQKLFVCPGGQITHKVFRLPYIKTTFFTVLGLICLEQRKEIELFTEK